MAVIALSAELRQVMLTGPPIPARRPLRSSAGAW